MYYNKIEIRKKDQATYYPIAWSHTHNVFSKKTFPFYLISHKKTIHGGIIMGIIGTEYYEKLRKEYERKKTKCAAKTIVKEQISTEIANEIIDSQISKLSQKIALANKKDMYTQKIAKIKIKEKLAVASLPLFIFSIITAVLSIFMSIAGISHVHTIDGMKTILNTEYWLPALLMGCFQTGTVVSSIIAYATKRQYKKLNRFANIFRSSVFVASVYSNHLLLCDLIPEYTSGAGIAWGWFFAAGADIMSNLFSTFSFALKNRMSDSEEHMQNKNHESYLSKIWFCITAKLRLKIDKAYQEKMAELEKYYKTGKTRKDNTQERIFQTETNMIKPTKASNIEQPKTNDTEPVKTSKNEPISYFKYLVPDNIETHEEKLNTMPKGTKHSTTKVIA